MEHIGNDQPEITPSLNNRSSSIRAILNDTDPPIPIVINDQIEVELPEDYESVQLIEAKEYYTEELPPFLQTTNHKTIIGSRIRVQLAKNGKLPKRPLQVDLISRPWKNGGIYWTMDLEGERLIVKTFRGGAHGGSYRRWEGIAEGFGREALAFPLPRPFDADKASHRERKFSYDLEGSDRLDRHKSRDGAVDTRRSAAQSAQKTIKEHITMFVGTSDSSSPSQTPALPSESDDVPDASSAVTLDSMIFEPSSIHTQRTQRPSRVLKLPFSGDFSQLARSSPSHKNDLVAKHSNTDHVASKSKPSKRRSANDRSEDFEDRLHRFLEPSEISDNASNPVPSSARKRTKRMSDYQRSINKITAHTEQSMNTSATMPVLNQSSPTETTGPGISLFKQEKTTLWFFLPPSEDCVPLRLRSCTEMSALFASAIKAFDLESEAHKVQTLRATFPDVKEGHPAPNLLIKKGMPDTFQIFLEVVDGLSGWEEGGNCAIRVDILMKG